MFHVAISRRQKARVDSIPLLNHATAGSSAPDTFAFAFQMPLFRVAGTTGSAIKVDVKGKRPRLRSQTATGLRAALWTDFGPKGVNPARPTFPNPSKSSASFPTTSASVNSA